MTIQLQTTCSCGEMLETTLEYIESSKDFIFALHGEEILAHLIQYHPTWNCEKIKLTLQKVEKEYDVLTY